MLGGGGGLPAPLAMTKKDAGHHGVRAEVALGDSAHILGPLRCNALRGPPDTTIVQWWPGSIKP
jgi:2-phospho-L-lactate transferase/gluconeogenesis factor (CofD/UPF0052 family)